MYERSAEQGILTDRIMKRIYIYITLAFVAALSFTGCHEQYVTYSDKEYVMFADTMAIYPVQKADSTFKIPVVSTVARDYDRTFGVEIIDKGSNAIERKHYHLESNTVTIPAGRLAADVIVHGYYSSFEATDSLGFELQLVMNEELEMPVYDENGKPVYGKNTKAVMMKSCPFNANDFTGYCVLTSMFLYQYSTTGSYQRLVYTEAHPTKENTVICRNWLADGYDVEITFNDDDPMKPFLTMKEDQIASDEGMIFGQTHGDDHILVTHSHLAESVFYPCGKYLYLWAHFYVENIGTSVGTVGHFYNIMEWVSEEEARRLHNVEGMPGVFYE